MTNTGHLAPKTLRNWLQGMPQRVNDPSLAAVSSKGTLSSGQLARFALQLASRFSRQGVAKGSRVATMLPAELDLAVNLALLYLGAVSYSVPKGLRLDKGEFGVTRLVSLRPTKDWPIEDQIIMDKIWLLETSGTTNFPTFQELEDNDACRFVVTSGSTGKPKGILLSFGQVEERVDRTESEGFEFSREFSFVSSAGWYGFRISLKNLISNRPLYLFSPDSGRLLEDLLDHEIETITGSPAQLGGLLKAVGVTGARFWSLKQINCVGGVLPRELFKRLKETFGCEIVVRYGSSETGNISSGKYQSDYPIGYAGFVRKDTDLQVVSEADELLEPGESGRIRIRNEFMISNYMDSNGDIRPAIDNGWFYTGDFGFLNSDGSLVVLGRSGSTLNVGGLKVEPRPHEEQIRSFQGVSDCIIFVVPDVDTGLDRLAVAVEVKNEGEFERVRQILEKGIAEIKFARIFGLDEFPRSAAGKVILPVLLEKLGLPETQQ